MLIGLVLVIPPTAVLASPSGLSPAVLGLLAAAGATNVVGLLVEYVAFRRGKVGLVTAIASTEGMVAAVISAVAAPADEERPCAPADEERPAEGAADGASPRRRRLPWGVLAVSTALLFGVSLYTTGRAGEQVSLLWTVVPARVFGSALVAAPLTARRRLRLTRRALPLVVAAGAAEVLGVLSYALGARHDLPVAAVLSAQFAALTAVAAYFIHGQRLSRRQLAGLAAVVAGVTLLAAVSP
jgi:uncharacterized membrane protein